MDLRLVTVSALALALLASGCSKGAEEDTQPRRDEAAFIKQTRDSVKEFDVLGDAQLLKVGDLFCQLSKTSKTKDEYTSAVFDVMSRSGSSGIRTVEYALVSGYALDDLCHDQAARWGNP